MIQNIRSMFSKMDETSKQDAFAYLTTEMNLPNDNAVLQDWISLGDIPGDYQPKIVLTFQNILRTQELRKRKAKVNPYDIRR